MHVGGVRQRHGCRTSRILLDENIPVQLKLVLGRHDGHSINDRVVGRPPCILVLPRNRRKVVLDLGREIEAVVASMEISDFVVLDITGAAVKRSLGG